MLERHSVAPFVLREPGEHFHKNLLRKILLRHAPRTMRAHELDDERIQVLDQRARRILVAVADERETLWHRESFMRHEDIASLR
jgi:hypothetical protein